MRSWLGRNWMRLYFAASLLLLAFVAGLVAAAYKAAPYVWLKQAREAVIDLRANAWHYSRREPTKFLYPAHSAVRGAVRRDPANTMPGVTLVSGLWGQTLGFRLLSDRGEVLHAWNVSFNEIWPNASHVEEPLHDWDTNIHGSHLYPNGDIVFNFEYAGTIRIDRDGRVLWKLPRHTSHSIYEDEEGMLWAPDWRKHKTSRPEFPGMKPPFFEDLLLRIDPAGNVLEEISVLKVLYESNLQGLLLLGGHTKSDNYHDWMHINDVEVLPSKLAHAFPQFAAGDIMVSARELNLVFIIDRRTHAVKWWRVGPWLRSARP